MWCLNVAGITTECLLMIITLINVISLFSDRGVGRHSSAGWKPAWRQADISCFVKSSVQKTQATWGRPTAASNGAARKVCTRDCMRSSPRLLEL